MLHKKLMSNSLAVRKELLIAESEINRALLAKDYRVLAVEIRAATEVIGKTSALLLVAKTVMTLFKSPSSSKPAAGAPQKNSWLTMSWNLLRMGLPLWLGFHQRQAAAQSKANGQASAAQAHSSP
jgi:hypothetical protein